MMFKKLERPSHKEFGRTTKVEAFVRTRVELPSDGVEFRLREVREIRSLGEILAEQSVGVLADAALPRAVWVGEVNSDVDGL